MDTVERVLTLDCPEARASSTRSPASWSTTAATSSSCTSSATSASNHPDLPALVERHGDPFVHVPVGPDTKPRAEGRLR